MCSKTVFVKKLSKQFFCKFPPVRTSTTTTTTTKAKTKTTAITNPNIHHFHMLKVLFKKCWAQLVFSQQSSWAEGCRADVITSVDSLRRSMRHKRMLGWRSVQISGITETQAGGKKKYDVKTLRRPTLWPSKSWSSLQPCTFEYWLRCLCKGCCRQLIAWFLMTKRGCVLSGGGSVPVSHVCLFRNTSK